MEQSPWQALGDACTSVLTTPWHPCPSRDPEIRRASVNSIRRAEAKALTVPPWTCPYCGLVLPGVTIDGHPRQNCSRSKCQGKSWGLKNAQALAAIRAESLRTGLPGRPGWLAPATVVLIRQSQVGPRILAKTLDVDHSTIFHIRKHDYYAWVPEGYEAPHD